MMTSPHENKTLVQRAADTWNARDRDGFLACYSDELLVRGSDGAPDAVITPDEHWAAALTWFERFPDFTETTQEMLAEDDKVLLRTRYTGTLAISWRGAEPTGAEIGWDAWQILRMSEGEIVEERMLMDSLGMFTKLGIVELPVG